MTHVKKAGFTIILALMFLFSIAYTTSLNFTNKVFGEEQISDDYFQLNGYNYDATADYYKIFFENDGFANKIKNIDGDGILYNEKVFSESLIDGSNTNDEKTVELLFALDYLASVYKTLNENSYSNDYVTANFPNLTGDRSVNEWEAVGVINFLENARKNYLITNDNAKQIINEINDDGISKFVDDYTKTTSKYIDKYNELYEKANQEYQKIYDDAKKQLEDKYDLLTSVNQTKSGNNAVKSYYGYYDDDYKTQLDETFATQKSNLPTYAEWCENSVVRFNVAESIKIMEGVPHNVFEYGYSMYDKWIKSLKEGEKTPSHLEDNLTDDENNEFNKIYSACEEAIEFYDSLTVGNELFTAYQSQYQQLRGFYDNSEQVTIKKVSSVTSADGCVTITAYDYNGSEVEVFNQNTKLKIWALVNGSAKRYVSSKLKGDNLAVRYCFYPYLYVGSNEVDLTKITGADSYKLKINTNAYSQLEEGVNNFAESTTEQVKSCYLYYKDVTQSSNDDVENLQLLDCNIEGSTIMLNFSYRFPLGYICLAGIDTSTFFSDPLNWVILAVALIVLIILIRIIIKLILKNAKYPIVFNTNGGNRIVPIRVSKKELIVMPEQPTKQGFIFSGWFTDKDCKVRFIETQIKKRKKLNLYAKWSAPVTSQRLHDFFEELRTLMVSYEKVSFKQTMGLSEIERIADLYETDNSILLFTAISADEATKKGFKVENCRDKKYAEVPSKMVITTETALEDAKKLLTYILANKGLQKTKENVEVEPFTDEERKQGFAFFIKNEKVAKTAEDYFALLRIALKSYVMSKKPEKFNSDDKVTLGRIYITNEVACLYLPLNTEIKAINKLQRTTQFADTPCVFKVLTGQDLLEAYQLIDLTMTNLGLTKCPENSNDLEDVKLPTTNGFAYIMKIL